MFVDMENIKVSVILPVYQVEKYLGICIESVINQSYQNLEILLIDDGSTDKSGKICDEYTARDGRIRVIHKENEGVSTARNVGIKQATGDYICFADSDDILEPDYVSYLLGMALDKHVDVTVATDFFTTFGGKQVAHDCVKVVRGEDAAADILYYHIPIGCYCKMFKRSYLIDNEILFFPDVYIGEGFNFNVLAFSKADKVAIGHRKVYCYRRDNTSSAMTDFKEHKAEMAIKAIQIIRDNLQIKSSKLLGACDYADWHTQGDMYNWMVLAKARRKYPVLYNQCYKKVHSYAFQAIFAPVNKKERFRAVVQFIHPRLLAFMLEIRRWKSSLKK